MRVLPGITLACCCATAARAQHLIAVRDATVIDGTGAPARAHQTVVVKDDRIWRVDSAGVALPAGTRVIDGRGMYVLPGFIDMHAHYAIGPVSFDTSKHPPAISMTYDRAASIEMLQTLLAYGVTSVRNPGGGTRESVALRDSVRLGFLRGPRIFTAGDVIDASISPGMVATVHNERDVRNEVGRQ